MWAVLRMERLVHSSESRYNPAHLGLGVQVGSVVGQHEEPVALVQKGLHHGPKPLRVAVGEGTLADQVQGGAKLRVALDHRPRVIPAGAQVGQLLGRVPEEEEVVSAHLVADLDVGARRGCRSSGPVQGELHVARARGLHAGGGDLLGEVGGGHELLA